MSIPGIIETIVGWAVILAIAFWYASKVKHSSRTRLQAFGIFCGIFGGLTLAGLILGIWVGHVFQSGKDSWFTVALGPAVPIAVVLPAFWYACARIRRARA